MNPIHPILHSPDFPQEDGAPQQELQKPAAEYVAEIEQLKITVATQAATILNLNAVKAEADADEKIILAKMNAGLSRPQATAVVKRQKQFDASKTGLKHIAAYAKFQAKKETKETAPQQ